jgi:hypothetical protein
VEKKTTPKKFMIGIAELRAGADARGYRGSHLNHTRLTPDLRLIYS